MSDKYCALPITYAQVINATTDDIKEHATNAELQRRGAGLDYIEQALDLGGR